MTLKEIMNWKALHFSDRTILRSDLIFLPPEMVHTLLNTEAEPMQEPGHYRVKEK